MSLGKRQSSPPKPKYKKKPWTSFWKCQGGSFRMHGCLTNLGEDKRCSTKDLDKCFPPKMVIYFMVESNPKKKKKKHHPTKQRKEDNVGEIWKFVGSGSGKSPSTTPNLNPKRFSKKCWNDRWTQDLEFLHSALDNLAWKTLGGGHT